MYSTIDIKRINKLEERVELFTIILVGILLGVLFLRFIYVIVDRFYEKKQMLTAKMPKKRFLNFLDKRIGSNSMCFYLLCMTFIIINSILIWVGSEVKELLLKSTGTFVSVSILLNVLLSIKHSPLIALTGRYYNDLINFHKFIGIWVLLLSIIHTICYIGNLSRPKLQHVPFSLIYLFVPIQRAYGTAALLCILLIGISSGSIRKNYYNLFTYFHRMLTVLFIVFTALHMAYFVPYAITGAVVLGIDYILRAYHCFISWKYKANIKLYGGDTDQYVSISFDRKNSFKSYVGQHALICIPEVSKLEFHPFSIISHSKSSIVELEIKALGDYTQKLIEYSKHSQTCDIRISGLFGSFSFNYLRYKELVLICGGIGVTPFIGILKELYYNPTEHCVENVILVWFCRDEIIYEVYKEFIDYCISINLEINKVFPYFMPIISIKTRLINKDYFLSIDLDMLFNEFLLLEQAPEVHKSLDKFDLEEINFEEIDFKELHESHEPSDIFDQNSERRLGVMCCGANALSNDVWDHCHNYQGSAQIDFRNHSF